MLNHIIEPSFGIMYLISTPLCAFRDSGRDCRVKYQAPTVERGIGLELFDQFFVVANAVGAPKVNDAVSILGILYGCFHLELRVHVLEIAQPRLIERQIRCIQEVRLLTDEA
jgi:hypothetical protein